MTRILYLISTLQRSGPVNVLFNLLKYLDRDRFEPIILTLSEEPADSSLADFTEIEVKVLSLNLSRIMGLFLARSRLKKIVDSIEDGVDTYAFDKRHFRETVKRVESYYSVFIGVAIYIVGFIFDHYGIAWGFIPLFWIGYSFIAYKIMMKTLKTPKR